MKVDAKTEENDSNLERLKVEERKLGMQLNQIFESITFHRGIVKTLSQ